MNIRFLIYPLLMVVGVQCGPLLRHGWQWAAGQFAQLALVLVVAMGALVLPHGLEWAIGAWGLYALFVLVPRWLTGLAQQHVLRQDFAGAARAWAGAGWLVWGEMGGLYRACATALRAWGRGDRAAADRALPANLPPPARHWLHGWLLNVLAGGRDWPAVVDFYEGVPGWSTLALATEARLLAARAYAETGRFAEALRCLQFVALSPRTVGALERQWWVTRVTVTALAGDGDELEALLGEHKPARHGWERFAALWRGRCAHARGDTAEAQRQLTRALALTPPRDRAWRSALAEHLRAAAAGNPGVPAADTAEYRAGREGLRAAAAQSVRWRGLLRMGMPPRVTQELLGALGLVLLAAQWLAPWLTQASWYRAAGNVPVAVMDGEWWRLATAMFLHDGALHLGMNAVGVWLFGAAVERARGGGRMLALFVAAGVTGNLLSASQGHYDVAVGASGGVFGLLGAFGVEVYRLRGAIYARARQRLLLVLAGLAGVDFVVGWLEPQIDNLAHLGGFLAGVALALAWPVTVSAGDAADTGRAARRSGE
jgi:membrane associated rhomboid family serine protease